MRYRLPLAVCVFCLTLAIAAPSFLVAEASDSERAAAPDKVSSADSRRSPSRGEAASRLPEPEPAAAERVKQNYGRLPLSFEANRGQTDARAQFIARNSAYSLYLAADGITMELRGAVAGDGRSAPGATALRIKLQGASRRPRAHGLDELQGKSNYMIGNDPSRWQTNVPHYARVRYEAVYPGVDVIYYGTNRELEYDFVVAPGADAKLIRLSVEGAKGLRVDENGDLVLKTAAGEVRQRAPHAYQEIDGVRQTVACRYVLRGAGRVGFELGAYDRGRQLVIDPVISYSTFLGGSGSEDGTSVFVDEQGNAYVTGETWSRDFPVTPNAPYSTLRNTIGGGDVFVTKLNAEGTAIVYSTHLGGNHGARWSRVAVDAAGQAHVVGETSATNFPTTPGAYRTTIAGSTDFFVTKLSADGSSLLYSSYLGGSNREHTPSIALGPGGELYVAGQTHSSNYPTTPGAFQAGPRGVSESLADGFVTKLTPTAGAGLIFSTYLGGANYESVEGLAVASGLDGSIYVTGRTSSTDFPTTPNAWQRTLASEGGEYTFDAFVTRLNSDGTQAVYSTLFGGTGGELSTAVAVGANGAAYIAGYTNSPNLHVTPGAFQTTYTASAETWNDQEGFVAKLSADGASVLYSTFYGGNGADTPYALALDAQGNAYVAGQTNSTNLPAASSGWQTTFGGGSYDGFFFKLDAAGAAVPYATYLGGSSWDLIRGVALGAAGDAYLVGMTYSFDFHATTGTFQPSKRADSDSFLTKLALGAQDYTVSGRVTNQHGNGLVDVEISVIGAVNRVVRTDAEGNYRVNGLPQGAEVTLTARRFDFVFDPLEGVTLSNLSQNETVNFSGPAPVLIRGHVLNEAGSSLGLFPVTVTGDANETVYTDYDGYYVFALPAGGNYTVTPDPNPEFTFSPPSRNVAELTADQIFDFTGLRPPRLEGRVYDSRYPSSGVSYINVTLTGPTLEQPVEQTTDSWGYFTFENVERGATYTVTPSDPASNRTFTPASQAVTVTQGYQFIEFAAQTPLTIWGWVAAPSGTVFEGAVAKLYGNTNPATMSPDIIRETPVDEWGNFSFEDLPRGGNFTVAITNPNSLYTFEPESRTVFRMQESQFFEFTARPPLRIMGQVADTYHNGLPATLTLTGTVNRTVQADEWGYFEFSDLPRGGNYTVTPSHPLYTFAPTSHSVSDIQEDQFAFFRALPPLRIMGQVADADWRGLRATLTLTGTVNRTMQADEDGIYEFTELPRGGTYTVTASLPLYTFNPPTHSVSDIQEDQFFHFEALPPLRISGGTSDENGHPIAGATVTLAGTVNATATTDQTGFYRFENLPRGGNYAVTPAHALYNFTPPSREFQAMSTDQVAGFDGALRRFTLGGRVADAGGAPVSGVTVTLGGGANAVTQTDAGGNYSFPNLVIARAYTVTAARPGFAFAPESVNVPDPRGDQTANFAGSRLNYTVSGRVTDTAGDAPLPGVSVSLTGTLSASTQTDAQGNYTFTELPSEGDYTVTPSHSNFDFAPGARPFTNLLANVGADFTGTRINYQIGGRVTDSSGAALSGVTVTLGGPRSATAQTNAAGDYLFADLPSGFDYTLTVARTHYAFSPPTRQVNNLGGNTTADFNATLLAHNIGGRVVDSNGNGFAGVLVSLAGTRTGSATTDAAGNYAFTQLPAGGNYTVEPSREFYDFGPVRAVFNDLGGDQAANFAATLRRFSIGGRVTEGASGVAGVTVTLGGSQSATTQTDAAGNYLFTQLPADGTYSVAPAHPFFAFSPASANFNTLPTNQSANFAAARLLYQVSGYALDPCGRPIPGLTMALARDGLTVNAQTNAAGFYSFTNVQAGYNYALAPTGSTHTFNPPSVSLPTLNANQTINFTGTPPVTTDNRAPLADTYVRGGSATTNFGTATQLIARRASQTKDTHETYIKFDAGAPCIISSVKLRIYGRLSSSGTIPLAVHGVPATTWTETGMNWNNKPAAGALLRTVNVVGTTATWYEWDVTDYVRAEIAAGRTTVSFVLMSTTTTNYQATFNSREATGTNAPRLVVTAQ